MVLVGPAGQQHARQSRLGRDVNEMEVRCGRTCRGKSDRAHQNTREGDRRAEARWSALFRRLRQLRVDRLHLPPFGVSSGAFGALDICAMARDESSSLALAAFVTIT